MNSCFQYKTKNRKEKRQISKYAIKKLKMKYKLGADASKAMMFAMTCVMAAAREHISYTSTIVISLSIYLCNTINYEKHATTSIWIKQCIFVKMFFYKCYLPWENWSQNDNHQSSTSYLNCCLEQLEFAVSQGHTFGLTKTTISKLIRLK